MKKILLPSFFVLLFFLDGHSQFNSLKMKEVEVTETGYSIVIDSLSMTDKRLNWNNIELQIKPIDPISLNTTLPKALALSGKYSYNYYNTSREAYFLKRKRPSISKLKSEQEMLLEGLEWLFENEKVDEALYNKIYADLNKENDDSSENGNDENLQRLLNPYFTGNKYLHVFKLTLINTSNLPQKFDAVLQLRSEGSMLESLTSDQILDFQEKPGKEYRAELLERYNLKRVETIPPKTSVSKYFAFMPIDLRKGAFDLFVSSLSESQKLSWEFNVAENTIDKKYFYYELIIGSAAASSISNEYIYIQTDADYFLDGRKLFINKEDITKPIRIFHYGISIMDNLYYSNGEIKASDYLDFSKSKRANIKLDFAEIEGIRKRK